MSKKTTSSSAPTHAAATSATTDAAVHLEQAGAANLLPGSAGSTDTPESEAAKQEKVGAGDTAGPAIRLPELSAEDIATLLSGEALAFIASPDGSLRVATEVNVRAGAVDAFVLPEGYEDFQHLAAMAVIGSALVSTLERNSALDGPLRDIPIGPDAIGIVDWMIGKIADLDVALDAERAKAAMPADASDKRAFVLKGNVRLNNVLKEIGDTVWLTIDEHAELCNTNACHWDWDQGMRA